MAAHVAPGDALAAASIVRAAHALINGDVAAEIAQLKELLVEIRPELRKRLR